MHASNCVMEDNGEDDAFPPIHNNCIDAIEEEDKTIDTCREVLREGSCPQKLRMFLIVNPNLIVYPKSLEAIKKDSTEVLEVISEVPIEIERLSKRETEINESVVRRHE